MFVKLFFCHMQELFSYLFPCLCYEIKISFPMLNQNLFGHACKTFISIIGLCCASSCNVVNVLSLIIIHACVVVFNYYMLLFICRWMKTIVHVLLSLLVDVWRKN